MTELKHTFKDDALFKMVFVKYPKLLKLLVARLLAISGKSIKKLRVTNPEMPPEFVEGKFCHLDINMIVDGQRVDLEIQVQNKGDYVPRALYLWAREYSTALAEGGKYIDLPITVVISIINFPLFDCEEFHSEFAPLEVTRHTILSDRMRFHFYELPKLPALVSAKDDLKLWLTLFSAETEEDLAKLESLGVPFMSQAIEAMRSVSASPKFREIARQREIARRDEESALYNAELKGEARGEARGEIKGKLAVAKNLLRMNLSIEAIMESTGLTRKEVENLQTN